MMANIRARSASAAAALAVAPALCLVTAAATALPAQEAAVRPAAAPYSSLTVALSASRQASSGQLSGYWDAGQGVRVDIHMPFYIGEAGLTGTTLRYESRSDAQPGFRAIIAGASWRFPVTATPHIRPAVSLEAGNFMTIFDGEQAKGLGKESELYVGGGASLDLAIAGGTAVSVGTQLRHVFTSTPIRLVSLHAGLAQTLATPGWLRAVIE